MQLKEKYFTDFRILKYATVNIRRQEKRLSCRRTSPVGRFASAWRSQNSKYRNTKERSGQHGQSKAQSISLETC